MPPYGKMKASSMLPIRNKLSCQPNDGFILSDKGWCPRRRNGKLCIQKPLLSSLINQINFKQLMTNG